MSKRRILSQEEVRKRLTENGFRDYEIDAVLEIVRGGWTDEELNQFIEILKGFGNKNIH